MSLSVRPTMELSLTPPSSFHSRFLFPGCPVEGKVAFQGIRINTLYTALVRHVGYVEMKGVDSQSSYSELVQSDASTMQFMCVTAEQARALPPEVLERITIHQVNSWRSGDDCYVIEKFKINLSPKSPNTFNCKSATCRNFVEVKCFSSEFGFHKALFPIAVQRATPSVMSNTTLLEGASGQTISKTCDLSPSKFWCLKKGSLKLSLFCPHSCFMGGAFHVRGDFSTTLSEACELFVDVESKAKVWVEAEKSKKSEQQEETVAKTRHLLGKTLKDKTVYLDRNLSLDWGHPQTGPQHGGGGDRSSVAGSGIACWTLVHLVAVLAGSEQVLATMSLEVKPQKVLVNRTSNGNLSLGNESKDAKASFSKSALRVEGEVALRHPSPAPSSRFDVDPGEERASKLRQNGSVTITPTNSPKKEANMESSKKPGNQLSEGGATISDSVHRSRQLREMFLGFLKMRYAAGDKTVIKYKPGDRVDDQGDRHSLSSDSYSDNSNNTQRHLLKRRIGRKKKSSNDNSNNSNINGNSGLGGREDQFERLESGEMSLRSEDPKATAALERSQSELVTTPTQLAIYQSLPGSVVDLPAVVDIPKLVANAKDIERPAVISTEPV